MAVSRKRYGLLVIVLFALALSQCSRLMGKGALSATSYPGTGTGEALVVFLPTIGGKGQHYEAQGFIEEIRARGAQVDLAVLDIKPQLYFMQKTVDIIKTEIIGPAKAKGYQRIVLVGTSLGGHGALLYATQYPEDVDGVFLLAPLISGARMTHIIDEAGGLDQWSECPFLAWDYACDLWRMLKGYLSDPRRKAFVFLGYGTEDRFGEACGMLAQALPPENVFTVPGGHDWVTWKKLWLNILAYLDVRKPFHRV